jgi:hypothetical protein
MRLFGQIYAEFFPGLAHSCDLELGVYPGKYKYMRTSVKAAFVIWFLSATWESDMGFIWLNIGFSLPQ